MKVRVAEAKTGVRLPDSKVTVKLGSQTIVENKKVKEELLVPIVSGGDYNITVDTGGKYFDMGTPVHIDCTLYKSCEECQEGLEVLIPLFEHSDIGAGNMSVTLSWSEVGPYRLDLVVKGRKVRSVKPGRKDPDNLCRFPNPAINITHKHTCKASFVMKNNDNKKRQNPQTLTFKKDHEFVYVIHLSVGTFFLMKRLNIFRIF